MITAKMPLGSLVQDDRNSFGSTDGDATAVSHNRGILPVAVPRCNTCSLGDSFLKSSSSTCFSNQKKQQQKKNIFNLDPLCKIQQSSCVKADDNNYGDCQWRLGHD